MSSQTLRFSPRVDLPFSPPQPSVQKQEAEVLTCLLSTQGQGFLSCEDQGLRMRVEKSCMEGRWGWGCTRANLTRKGGLLGPELATMLPLQRGDWAPGLWESRLAPFSSGASCSLLWPPARPAPSLKPSPETASAAGAAGAHSSCGSPWHGRPRRRR